MNPSYCIHHKQKRFGREENLVLFVSLFSMNKPDHIQEFEAIRYVYYPKFMVNIVVNFIFNNNFCG